MSRLHPGLKAIRHLVKEQTTVTWGSIHGPDHWARVEANGLKIAHQIGADTSVVVLFALLHDSQRLTDGSDPDHGPRAAAFAEHIRPQLDFIDDHAFAKLHHASTWHTHQKHHEDLTIGACFDADRLDLGRVGIMVDPSYLNSPAARDLVDDVNERWLGRRH